MAEQDAQRSAAEMRFAIQRVYVKDLSFESPAAPSVFEQQWKPRMHLDINTRAEHLRDELHEVVLSMTLRASDDEDRTAFIIEVQQAGIFTIGGVEGGQLQQVLATACPGILFPYARECVDMLAIKGSFPPIMLAPVNFDALYQQTMAQQQAAAQEQPKH